MASTNKTKNIGLSQFLGTDKPQWLDDYNADMKKIDEAVLPVSGIGQENMPNVRSVNNRKIIYVDCENGNDENDGTQEKPLKTLDYAIANYKGAYYLTIILSKGVYTISANAGNSSTVNGFNKIWIVGAEDGITYVDVPYSLTFDGGFINLENLYFTGNYVGDGNVGTIIVYDGILYMNNCTIESNTTADESGSAIYARTSNVYATNLTVKEYKYAFCSWASQVSAKNLAGNCTTCFCGMDGSSIADKNNTSENTSLHYLDITSSYNNVGEASDGYTKAEVDNKITNLNTSITNIVNGTTTVAKATSADNLLNSRTINDTVFDNTKNIRLLNSINYALPNNNSSNKIYQSFARLSNTNSVGNNGATFLLSAAGRYSGVCTGAWFVEISNRGSTPSMYVYTAIPNTADAPNFGYYENNGYFYFGMLAPAYSAGAKITILRNEGGTFTDYYNSTTMPTGWTANSNTYSMVFNTHTQTIAGTKTFSGNAVMKVDTDYTTARARNIILQDSTPTSISNGNIVGVYE